MDAEMLISEEQDEYNRSINKGRSTPNNRSNTSLNRLQQQQQLLSQQPNSQQQLHPSQHQQQQPPYPLKQNPSTTSVTGGDKRSRLDRIFGRRTSTINSTGASLRNHQVTPHPQPSSPSQQPQQLQSSGQSNTLAAATTNGQHPTSNSNSSAVDLHDLSYLQVEEGGTDDEEEVVLDRSMGAGVGSATSGAPVVADPVGTEVKLHPTRAKTFALPKSLRNLKRRIAALRARGTDLDAEKREKEERERAANGGVGVPEEKKKFTLIRLLPWKSSKKPAA